MRLFIPNFKRGNNRINLDFVPDNASDVLVIINGEELATAHFFLEPKTDYSKPILVLNSYLENKKRYKYGMTVEVRKRKIDTVKDFVEIDTESLYTPIVPSGKSNFNSYQPALLKSMVEPLGVPKEIWEKPFIPPTSSENFIGDGVQHTFYLSKAFKMVVKVYVYFSGRRLNENCYQYDPQEKSVYFHFKKEPAPPQRGTKIEVDIVYVSDTLPFGKYKGRSIKTVDIDYLCWLVMMTLDTNSKYQVMAKEEFKRRGYSIAVLQREWQRLVGIGAIEENGYRNFDVIRSLESVYTDRDSPMYPRLVLDPSGKKKEVKKVEPTKKKPITSIKKMIGSRKLL